MQTTEPSCLKLSGILRTLLLCALLSGCAHNTKTQSQEDNHIRLEAVAQTAQAYGAQGGLAWRAAQLQLATQAKADNLDRIFRFDNLMLPNHLIPPVLTQSKESIRLDDPSTIRLASHTYRILQAARFTTTPISWRNYINLSYPTPEAPDSSLQPKNALEVDIWNDAIEQGWQQGIAQADAMYQDSLAHLKQDFVGMSLYHTLLAQHIVTPPFVATTKLGITGNKDQLRVGDQVLRIAATSELNPHANAWDPGLSTSIRSKS